MGAFELIFCTFLDILPNASFCLWVEKVVVLLSLSLYMYTFWGEGGTINKTMGECVLDSNNAETGVWAHISPSERSCLPLFPKAAVTHTLITDTHTRTKDGHRCPLHWRVGQQLRLKELWLLQRFRSYISLPFAVIQHFIYLSAGNDARPLTANSCSKTLTGIFIVLIFGLMLLGGWYDDETHCIRQTTLR